MRRLLTRELFSFSTVFLLVLPLLMHTPAGGESMIDRAEHSVAHTINTLPIDDYKNFITVKTKAFNFNSSKRHSSSRSGNTSLTAGGAPIFFNYSG